MEVYNYVRFRRETPKRVQERTSVAVKAVSNLVHPLLTAVHTTRLINIKIAHNRVNL